MTLQCTLIIIGGFVSGTFVGALSIAAVSRFKVAVADDVLASLIELRRVVRWRRVDVLPHVHEEGPIINFGEYKAMLARADIAIFNATEQPCSR